MSAESPASGAPAAPTDFIRDLVAADVAAGRHARPVGELQGCEARIQRVAGDQFFVAPGGDSFVFSSTKDIQAGENTRVSKD